MEFRIETERFCEDVLAAMRGRVQAIARDRWLRTGCRVSVTQLAAEQTDRERLFRVACERVSSTNWDEVRRHLPAHPFIR